MKKAFMAMIAAVLLLSGCTIEAQSQKKAEKPQARKYTDSIDEPEYEVPDLSADDEEPEFGQPPVYKDFCFDDEDYINKFLVEKGDLFTFTYWYSYNDDGEYGGPIDYMPRMQEGDTAEYIAAAYGAELVPVDLSTDKMYYLAYIIGKEKFKQSVSHAVNYCDIKYSVPGYSLPFSQYIGLRVYFDSDGLPVLAVYNLNEDLMLLEQADYDKWLTGDQLDKFSPYEVSGETLIPRAILNDMDNYSKLRTDIDYPVFDFDDEYVTVQWYDAQGNTTEGHGILKSGAELRYSYSGESIDFELPEGGDSMETYIGYNRPLDCYELHDPYWQENYGCTLLLGRALQQEDG